MPAAPLHFTLLAVMLLAACERPVSIDAANEAAPAEGAAPAAAEGKAEEGRFSIKAPGFDMKIDIPAGVTSHGDSDNDLLYPGSTLSGLHVEGGKGGAGGKGDAGIELRFTTTDAPEKVAAWYRDPARATGFSITAARQDGSATIITGKEKKDGDPFTLRLSSHGAGGTAGRLTLSDRS